MTVLPDDGLSLAAEFPDATREQWQRLVEGVLRKSGRDVSGAAAEDALATALEDGLATRPLYTARGRRARPRPARASPPFVRGGQPRGHRRAGWDVRQRHARADPRQANEAVLADLENGVTSLWLAVGAAGLPVVGAARGPRRRLPRPGPGRPGRGRASSRPPPGAAARCTTSAACRAEAARGNLGADPLGHAGPHRAGRAIWPQAAAPRWRRAVPASYPGLRALTVDALPYHEAGASAGAGAGLLARHRRRLPARADRRRAAASDAACAQLEFRYAATADQFLTIAKLRAARRLWARVAEVCGVDAGARGQRQHAVTSPVMMTRRDPWVNMLRTTIACLGAGVGGADAVTVLPFDDALGLPDAFARRIARNTSTILHGGVAPGPGHRPGGRLLVRGAAHRRAGPRRPGTWFQEIERAGGQAAALRSRPGRRAPRRHLGGARRRDLAHRREPITGVSEFPNLGRAAGGARARRPPARPAACRGSAATRRSRRCGPAPTRTSPRPARGPRVFLAALGPAAAHTARATFAANLFQAGGIEPVHDPVTVDADVGRRGVRRSGATVACLCSSDALYAEQAEAVAGGPEGGRAPRACSWPGGPATGARLPAPGSTTSSSRAATRSPSSPPSSTAWEWRDDADPATSPASTWARRRPPAATRRRSGARPCAGGDRQGRRRPGLGDARGHRVKPLYTGGRPGRASTSWAPTRASRRTCAARTRRCTSTSRGRSASTPGSPPPRSPTPSTGATSRPGRRACRSPSTCPPTAATTATTRG